MCFEVMTGGRRLPPEARRLSPLASASSLPSLSWSPSEPTETWLKFPHMSHVFIVDPDWEPVASTISRSDLDFVHDAFAFTIFDRNSHTTRRSQWLVRHQPNISFTYRLHEQLTFPMAPGTGKLKVWLKSTPLAPPPSASDSLTAARK